MSSYLGSLLKENIMAGQPSRTKSAGDYTGIPVPPCGDFSRKSTSIVPPPWMPPQASVGPVQRLSLHREIEHFVTYMKPTTNELALREDLVSRFTALIAKLDPKAEVQPVGSYVTGLFLPTSDIDMVITFDRSKLSYYSPKSYLSLLQSKIQASGFSSRIESVLQASVPLLRITDAKTRIQIDLTGSDHHGVRATAEVKSWMKENGQVISTLVIVIKFFLSIRRLSSTYTGGINSYLLVWMVVAWVRLEMPKMLKATSVAPKPSVDIDALTSAMGSLSTTSTSISMPRVPANANPSQSIHMGAALLSFLKFYGSEFDCTSQAIKFTSAKTVKLDVKTYPYSRYAITQRYLLSITDPADATVDMGSKAYAIKHVQASFLEGFRHLLSLIQGTANRNEIVRATVEGTLGSFLGGDYTDFIAKRRRILNNWRNT